MRQESYGWVSRSFYRMVREGQDKGTSEKRPAGSEDDCHVGDCGTIVAAGEIASPKALRSKWVWFVQGTRRPFWGGVGGRNRSWEAHAEKDVSDVSDAGSHWEILSRQWHGMT